MAIITISRQVGSLGTEIAKQLSRELNYVLLDKETLASSLGAYGISDMDKYDEKKPGLAETFSSKNYMYIHFLQSSIYQFARKGNCIILGRGGQFLLRLLPGVMKVHVCAPDHIRLERIRQRFDCDHESAQQIMEQSDSDRAAFHRFFFSADWNNPGMYDMIINTRMLSPTKGAELITDALPSFDTLEIQQQTRSMLADFCLGQDVITHIYEKGKIPVAYLKANAQQGVVTLEGGVMNRPEIDICEHAAMEVPGVQKVINRVNALNTWGGIA